MKPASITFRFLIIGIFGTLLIITTVPLMRVGLTALAMWRSDRMLAEGLPGPALTQLLRVNPWQPWYPRLKPLVSARIAACLSALDEAGLAAGFDDPSVLAPTPEPSPQRLSEHVLLQPNRLANLLIDHWHARWPPLGSAELPDVLRGDDSDRGDHRALLTVTSQARSRPRWWRPGEADRLPAQPAQPPVTPAPPRDTVPEEPPPDLPVRPGQRDSQWGIVNVPEARTYDTNGRFQGRVPAGTLLSISQVRRADVGDIAVATLRTDSGTLRDVVIRATDIRIRPGAIDRTSARERELNVRLADIEASITARESELEAAFEARNPHADEFHDIRARYAEFWKGIEERQAAHEKATGGERMRLANELRQLKVDDVRFRREFEAVRTRYQEWKQRNQAQLDIAGDATMQRLVRQRRDVEDAIGRLR